MSLFNERKEEQNLSGKQLVESYTYSIKLNCYNNYGFYLTSTKLNISAFKAISITAEPLSISLKLIGKLFITCDTKELRMLNLIK